MAIAEFRRNCEKKIEELRGNFHTLTPSFIARTSDHPKPVGSSRTNICSRIFTFGPSAWTPKTYTHQYSQVTLCTLKRHYDSQSSYIPINLSQSQHPFHLVFLVHLIPIGVVQSLRILYTLYPGLSPFHKR